MAGLRRAADLGLVCAATTLVDAASARSVRSIRLFMVARILPQWATKRHRRHKRSADAVGAALPNDDDLTVELFGNCLDRGFVGD